MGFDLDALRQAACKYGPIARVVVADVAGSTPRDVGASMLVWKTGQSGTIGGGALEYKATRAAREAIEQGKPARCLAAIRWGLTWANAAAAQSRW